MDDSSAAVTFFSGATATVSWNDDHVVLKVVGEVDESFAEAGASVTQLVAGLHRPVQVDVSGVALFTAAGVSWPVRLYEGIPDGVRVVAASELVLDVLAVCRVPLSSSGLRPARRQRDGSRSPADRHLSSSAFAADLGESQAAH